VTDVSSVIESFAGESTVSIIKPSEVLCDSSHCNVNIGDNALYRDDDHLSTFGAKYLSPLFSRAFKAMAGH
jgi:hypothetical protein